MFTVATSAAPGRPNEDAIAVAPDLAVVVDGAGVPTSGCHHGVPWYAQQLAAHTLAVLLPRPGIPLREGLARGISAVNDQHRDTCDLTSGGTPCAAVAIMRLRETHVDVLSLSDASVILDTHDGVRTFCDLAIEAPPCAPEQVALAGLTFGTPAHANALALLVAHQTRTRNRVGGWWVAAAEPEAAQYAIAQTLPREAIRRAAVLTDGATRPVDQMGIYGWPEYLDLLDTLGPTELIAHIRAIEQTDPTGARYPRTKPHDDATIAYYTHITSRA